MGAGACHRQWLIKLHKPWGLEVRGNGRERGLLTVAW